MKNITKSFTSRLVSAVMALLLIFTVFASFGAIKAQAAIGYVPAPEGDGITDVYYLFDYYPEVGNTKMAQEYPHVDIVYDRCVDDIEQTLLDIAAGIYNPIRNVPMDATVVIDVKTCQPSSELLKDVFWYIKDSLYCKTIFVTVYNELDFSDDDPDESFFDYLDKFYTSDDVRLEAFCDLSSYDAKVSRESEDETLAETLNDTCILIDGNIVNSNSLFGHYSFLRILLEQLWIALDHTHTPNTAYLAMINHLKQEHNVSFLVHTTGNSFKDLATNVTYTASNGNYPEAIDGGEYGDLNYSNIYAIGFFQLSNDFYDYLYATQQVRGITVYLLEADPFTYSEDGLDVITDYELEQMYNEGYYDLDTFMNELMELV